MLPNSPGANVRAEQKPSEDVISNVSPSEDLELCQCHHHDGIATTTYQVRSVNVA